MFFILSTPTTTRACTTTTLVTVLLPTSPTPTPPHLSIPTLQLSTPTPQLLTLTQLPSTPTPTPDTPTLLLLPDLDKLFVKSKNWNNNSTQKVEKHLNKIYFLKFLYNGAWNELILKTNLIQTCVGFSLFSTEKMWQ